MGKCLAILFPLKEYFKVFISAVMVTFFFFLLYADMTRM